MLRAAPDLQRVVSFHRMRRVSLFLVALMYGFNAWGQDVSTAITGQQVPCVEGTAAGFACTNVDLMAFLPDPALGVLPPYGTNDVWGWTDPQTGKAYALVGLGNGVAFVDVSDPVNPVFLGTLETHADLSPWRDVKVYRDHAFIVADMAGLHGMQVFDLTQLRAVVDPPAAFVETAHYDAFGSAHNLAINEASGFAYVVGGSSGGNTCGGGLHMVDIRDPTGPRFAGCYGPGYTHDAQCVIYHGPDVEHQGREICLGSNKTYILIADVTDKNNPRALAEATYPTVGYVHQGWLTDDHRYFIQNDEADERRGLVSNTRTLIWDLADVDDPYLVKEYFAATTSIDHNLYIVGAYMYQANYASGFRLLDIGDATNPVEVAFFDTAPREDNPNYLGGAWTAYPYFGNGLVVVSSLGEGLFILRLRDPLAVAAETAPVPQDVVLEQNVPNPFHASTEIRYTLSRPTAVSLTIYDILGRRVRTLVEGGQGPGVQAVTWDGRDDGGVAVPSGVYVVRLTTPAFEQTKTIVVAK